MVGIVVRGDCVQTKAGLSYHTHHGGVQFAWRQGRVSGHFLLGYQGSDCPVLPRLFLQLSGPVKLLWVR